MSSPPSVHGTMAVLSLLALMVWGGYRVARTHPTPAHGTAIDIGIEHPSGPADVHITRSAGATAAALTDIRNNSKDVIHISLPEHWVRGEVRGVPIAALESDEPSLGYRRWSLPPGADVSFSTQTEWMLLTLHNASPTPLKVSILTVDLAHNQADADTYLLQDQPLTLHF